MSRSADPPVERAVVFTPGCVQAILEGRKSQARRAIEDPAAACPFGRVGDRLWLQEPWRLEAGRVSYRSLADGDEEWRPARSLPRECARVVLEVTATRLERLREISERDLRAEAAPAGELPGGTVVARAAFARWWDSVHPRDGTRWQDDPWVWVVEFRRVRADAVTADAPADSAAERLEARPESERSSEGRSRCT